MSTTRVSEPEQLAQGELYRAPASWQTIVMLGSPAHKLLLAAPKNMSMYDPKIYIMDPKTGTEPV